METDDVSEINL